MSDRYTPTCGSNPSLAETATEIDIYGMGPRAQAVWDYLEGAACLYWTTDNRFICTDEALDFDAPRWEGQSLADFLKWLDGLYDEIFEEDYYAENNL
jgi:hypothetical protein